MKPWSVVLANDQPVLIEGLKKVLNHREFQIVATVADGHALVKTCLDLRPDLIISDIDLPLLNGIEAARQILKRFPKTKIIFLTMHHEAVYVTRAMQAGAKGYLLKTSSPEELVKAVHCVLNGLMYVTPSLDKALSPSLYARRDECSELLTRRQREVLQLLSEGKQPKEIASILHISPRTVEFHKYSMLEKLGLRTTAELIAWAAKQGIF